MEPLKPDTKSAIRAERPEASPEDIEEYERLLAERFATDPSAPAAAPERTPAPLAREQRENRLAELHQKLFGQ
jgi:hypothetical protein